MSDTLTDVAVPTVDSSRSAGEAGTTRSPRRRLLPRFGLRTLFVIAILFCLLFGWIGRNLYRVRQEDAAMDSLLRANAAIYLIQESLPHPQAMADPTSLSIGERTDDWLARVAGWSGSPRIFSIAIDVPGRDDPAADEALTALSFFPDVEEVALSGQAFDDASIQLLGRLPRLRSLMLKDTRVTAAGLAAMPAPERIRQLVLGEFGGERDLLVGVARLTELRSMTIGRWTVSRGEMDAVAALPRLDNLTLPIIRPDDEDLLTALARSESLRELNLSLQEWAPGNPVDFASIPIPSNVERVSLEGLRSDELPLIVPGPNLKILMLKQRDEEMDAAAFSAQHRACQVQLYGWSCTPHRVYVAGRPAGPGNSQPLP